MHQRKTIDEQPKSLEKQPSYEQSHSHKKKKKNLIYKNSLSISLCGKQEQFNDSCKLSQNKAKSKILL